MLYNGRTIVHPPGFSARRKVVGTGRHQRTAGNALLGAAAGAGSRRIAGLEISRGRSVTNEILSDVYY